MALLGYEEFIKTLGRSMKPQMNMTVYYDKDFPCSCGNHHVFNEDINILAEAQGQSILVQCPTDGDYFSIIKIKTKFLVVFKGFEYIGGHKAENPKAVIVGFENAFNR